MSKIKIVGHASGSGVLTIAAPNTNTDRTITIPDVTGTLLDSGSALPAANLTGTIADARFPATLPALSAANLTAIPAGNLTGTVADARFPATLPARSGANLTALPAANLTGSVGDARIPALTASKLTGALPAIDGSNLIGVATTTNTSVIENNIALLAFYRATDHSLSKYSLVDQVIDEYTDTSGIDASNSTQEYTTGGYYRGRVTTSGNATGGTITTSGSYTYHAFLHTGGYNAQTTATWTAPSTGTIDYLIVGGGGSGQSSHAGGLSAGRGGYNQLFTGQSKTAADYTIVTGGGGQGYTSKNNGQASSAFGTTKNGGTWGYNTCCAGSSGDTFSQFSQFGVSGVFSGGGGYYCQNGGSGGGGRGGCASNDNPPHATANTGGGGGSGNQYWNASGHGGSGVVLIRYLTNAFTTYAVGDLTLQSTANTASSAPTTGDIVMLIENAAGTATLNTDVKGYVSRNGGTTFTQGTLTDEGSWGTNKKILAFHNLDISGQSSGTDMRYKITTHNQSASKETRIHATSIAWAQEKNK